jgi:hypothetical protein
VYVLAGLFVEFDYGEEHVFDGENGVVVGLEDVDKEQTVLGEVEIFSAANSGVV